MTSKMVERKKRTDLVPFYRPQVILKGQAHQGAERGVSRAGAAHRPAAPSSGHPQHQGRFVEHGPG